MKLFTNFVIHFIANVCILTSYFCMAGTTIANGMNHGKQYQLAENNLKIPQYPKTWGRKSSEYRKKKRRSTGLSQRFTSSEKTVPSRYGTNQEYFKPLNNNSSNLKMTVDNHSLLIIPLEAQSQTSEGNNTKLGTRIVISETLGEDKGDHQFHVDTSKEKEKIKHYFETKSLDPQRKNLYTKSRIEQYKYFNDERSKNDMLLKENGALKNKDEIYNNKEKTPVSMPFQTSDMPMIPTEESLVGNELPGDTDGSFPIQNELPVTVETNDVTEEINFIKDTFEFDSKMPPTTTAPDTFPVLTSDKDKDAGTDDATSDTELLSIEEGSGSIEGIREDATVESNISGRFLSAFAGNSTNCTTPLGESGHCKSISECTLKDVMENFSLFVDYVCLSRHTLVGICCPDNPVVEVTDENEAKDATSDGIEEFKQPTEGCGLSQKTRIVGGTISVPHEWSWMVALLRRNRFFCGGVIINDRYVLTAAHCVLGLRLKDLSVRLGEYNFQERNEHQHDIAVTEIKRHAMFVTMTFQHDIALLKLKRRIEYSKFIGSICLPERTGRDYSDSKATVVGWGTVSFGGSASPVLRQVSIPVWDNVECDRTYVLENINEAFMCAGSPENGEDACQGDSGGPLMTTNNQGRWEVIGIVSWGRRCGDPTYPGVYTNVTSYINWIQENIK